MNKTLEYLNRITDCRDVLDKALEDIGTDLYLDATEHLITGVAAKDRTEQLCKELDVRVTKALSVLQPAPQESKPTIKIHYGCEDNPYEKVYIYFNKCLSFTEQTKVEDVVNYWSRLPFISPITSQYLFNSITEYHTLVIDAFEADANSSNTRKHKPLELLYQYLTEGTPTRNTKNNTRAVNGLGDIVTGISAW